MGEPVVPSGRGGSVRLGARLGGRFELEAVAGAGGMGTVYRGRDHESGREVAVKVLDGTGVDDLSRFDHEAQVVGTIDHPNVVRYVSHGITDDGRAYLVLEWLEGEDLAARLAREPITLRDALRLGRILSRALGYAHARGIVHRDVKPANVFLVQGRVEGAKLLDFGIARSLDSPKQVTRSGTALGTPAYMAPEQARGERAVDARADVFSVGCVLFECLAGRPPFVGTHVVAILAKVLFEEAPRLSSLRLDLPPALDELVARMMSKSAADRPRDGDEVARLLEPITPSTLEVLPEVHGTERPREITRGEQRLLAIVMVGAEPGKTAKEDDPTVATEAARSPQQIAAAVTSFGAKYSPLANGSSIAVLAEGGSATDLALRAARCALSLRALRPDLRIALAMGRGVSAGNMPVGEVIDRAATLVRRSGDPGDPSLGLGAGIAIDDLVAGLLDERFDVGGGESGLWLRAEREGAFGVRQLLGRPSPCVGRARELLLLESAFEECVAEPSARGVLVTGAVGMGKSRLRHELLERLRGRDDRAEVWLGRADPIAVGAPLGVLGSALRTAFGLADGEPLAARRRKVRARVGRHLSEADASRVAEFVGEIVGVPFPDEDSVQLRSARQDPTLMGDRMLRAFEDLVDAETAAHPLVIVLEDLQWGDGTSVRLMEAAMRHSRERPLFVLAVGRTEVSTIFPTLALARGWAHIGVGELSRRACEQLVSEILGSGASPTLRDQLIARAGGNAFYLEELLRHVVEGRGAALPETILAMLQARIEALAPEPRRILRAASVLGTTFWSGAIFSLTGGTTRTIELRDWMPILLAEELVERRGTSRFPGNDEYVFRHALLRDAAYAMLTTRDREIGHRLAGEWLESAGETAPFVLGEHFERGAELPRAAEWLARAAKEALEGHDVDGTLAVLSRARAASSSAQEHVRGAIALLEAEAQRWKGDFAAAERAANEAVSLFRTGRTSWFRALEEAMNASGRRGAYELAIDFSDQIESAPPDPAEPGARDARTLALCAAGRQLFHAGGYEAADAVIDRVRAEIDEGPARDPRVLAEVFRLLGARARHLGDLTGDLDNYRRALAEYERAGDERNACNARVSVGFAYLEVGDFATARPHLEAALREAERMGLAVVTTRAQQNLGLVLAAEGSLEAARELQAQVAQDSRAQGNARFEGWTRVYLARVLLALGEPARAREEAERAATILEVTPPARAGALAVLALACEALSLDREAELHARGALAVLDSFGGIEEFESIVWLAAVRAARASGDEPRARQRLERAIARLDARAAAIVDPEMRESFLSRVTENAELRALSSEPWTAGRRAHLPPARVEPSAAIRAAYDPAAFEGEARLIVERLAQHLAGATAGEGLVNRGAPLPAEMLERFEVGFPEAPDAAMLGPLLTSITEGSVHQHHPRYLGYQVSAPLPRAALLTLVASLLNSGMAAYDSGPVATVLEKRVMDWMLGLLGWGEGSGVLTSGGSLGNLTALLAARQARAGFDVREEGLASHGPLAILCSDQTHYSIERAAQIMGHGRSAVVALPSDAAFRLDPRAIGPAMRDLRARGITPFALVASAGSTGVGAIDPLSEIADACAEHDLWMHVDGAHGASALLSSRHRAALSGIERADSVVWDAHKLMSMPALVTAVLLRDRRAAYATFAQRASYLYDDAAEEPWQDIGLRTIECTKPLLSVPLYVSLRTLGTGLFGELVDHAHALARSLAEKLEDAADFELACVPDSNIVCFRHVPRGGQDLDALQRTIRARVRAEGRFFIVITVLRGSTWLRTSLMTPATSEDDLDALLDAVRAAAVQ